MNKRFTHIITKTRGHKHGQITDYKQKIKDENINLKTLINPN